MGISSRFASDNTAGVHPAVLAAIAAANEATAPSYGEDRWTAEAVERLRAHFGPEARIVFASTGTAANVVALAALLRPHESVLCAASAHIAVDECGAPERFTGSKLVPVPTPDGRLTPDALAPFTDGLGDPHRVQPRVVSVAQPTELGTVYSLPALRALADWSHAHGLLLHVDGARLANAAVALDTDLSAFATCGIDALTFGATKNGALAAEAVVFPDPSLPTAHLHVQKQAMQLTSKMRFVAAQFTALLHDDLWRANARTANAAAAHLSTLASALPAVTLLHPTQTNAVFTTLPPRASAALRAEYAFEWHPPLNAARWMTAFDTTEEDVTSFTAALHRALST